MLPVEVLRHVRRLHLRARRLVQTLLGGEYHSAFKGAGLSFEEVREYQPGDDVRTIDWNVTARIGHPFIKRFVEERELTLILAVDVSASQGFGTQQGTKRAVAAELAALLALCAVSNNDRVGLLAFSSVTERYVPPNKGPRHVLRLLRDLLAFNAQHAGTNLAQALDHINKIHCRRAIVFVLSDFLDRGYDDAFRRTAYTHDLIAVRIRDPRETSWPAIGLIRLQDAETGQSRLVDTRSRAVREAFATAARTQDEAFLQLTRRCHADVIDASTDGHHFDALLNFFRQRERRRR